MRKLTDIYSRRWRTRWICDIMPMLRPKSLFPNSWPLPSAHLVTIKWLPTPFTTPLPLMMYGRPRVLISLFATCSWWAGLGSDSLRVVASISGFDQCVLCACKKEVIQLLTQRHRDAISRLKIDLVEVRIDIRAAPDLPSNSLRFICSNPTKQALQIETYREVPGEQGDELVFEYLHDVSETNFGLFRTVCSLSTFDFISQLKHCMHVDVFVQYRFWCFFLNAFGHDDNVCSSKREFLTL